MTKDKTRIIHYKDLPLGGFAGVVEKQMVLHPVHWPAQKARKDISHGLGDFIYLAMGYLKPQDGAPLHPHKNVDIVSVVLSGSLSHEGSLGHGTVIQALGVQVQRAGSGMRHAEFNKTDANTEIVQIWFQPPVADLEPAYQNFNLQDGALTTVLGGNDGNSFNNNMTCQVGYVPSESTLRQDQRVIVLITEGQGFANDLAVNKGDLIEAEGLQLFTRSKVGLVLISENKPR